MSIDIKNYLENLEINLSSGAHKSPQDGICIMECVAYINGEEHSDKPACACPVITAFAIRTNDWMIDSERSQLLPFVLRIAGSKATKEIERQRGYIAADYAVRVFAPIALRARSLEDLAKRMEECQPITDKDSSLAARNMARQVRVTAYAYAATVATAAADAAAADAAAYAAADAAAYAAAAAAENYHSIRSILVSARLRMMDDMLKLTEHAELTPTVEVKLHELEGITAMVTA